LATAKQELDKSQRDLAQVQTRVDTDRSTLQREISETEARLTQAEACLPAEFLPHYRRMTKAHQADALAAIESQTCGGCYQSITPQMLNELQMSQLVTCKSCGRLLYLPE
jgi:hypothetical protein